MGENKHGAIEVSIIMPCYNDGAYIKEAIESVKLQENVNTEIIIIDDGSDDVNTMETLNSIHHERIHVLNTTRIGPSGARNEGIHHASGDYILPLDADDRIDAQYISIAKAKLEADLSIGAVYCHADLFGEAKGLWQLPDYCFERMLIGNVVFVTAMFRKADWKRIGGFKTNMKDGLEDYDFFLSILELDKRIVQLPDVLFHYRIKKKSRTTAFLSNVDTIKRAYCQIYENHIALYQRHMDVYVKALRDELIQQQYEKQKLINATEWMQKLKKIPFVVRLAKKILRH